MAELRSGRVSLETDWQPGDAGRPGLLSLRLEDQETCESVEGRVRLNPWIADEYRLIEPTKGEYFVLCGGEAIVAIDASTLALTSSMALEYEEGTTLDAPWHMELPEGRLLLATERRVWCLDERGAIRWVWGCQKSDSYTPIVSAPVLMGDRLRVPLWKLNGELYVEIQVSDGLRASV